MHAPVSDDVVRFLREEIDSVRELEMLLLLRARGSHATTPAALSAQLRIGSAWAEEQLERMLAKDLLSSEHDRAGRPAYRYAPRPRARAEIVDAVARLFQTRRTSVIRLVFAERD